MYCWQRWSALLDQVYHVPNIPRFTEDDAQKLIDENGRLAIQEYSKVTVRDLYNAKLSATLVALEEADSEEWSWGRLACIGDAIHKMTPNLGCGRKLSNRECGCPFKDRKSPFRRNWRQEAIN